MLFRKNSTKATRAPKSVSPPSGLHYDTLLGISYFDLNKESKRSKGMSKLASKKSESTTPLISADNSSGSSSHICPTGTSSRTHSKMAKMRNNGEGFFITSTLLSILFIGGAQSLKPTLL
ncbi:hypothetical protein KEM48_006628 [Puccinia striiformis f. sp. tritici PST-130]|nr:hypothetical protein KEM48_006628 [Puccinia striiformis f. sp. tritici PST-130]